MKELVNLLFQTKWSILFSAKAIVYFLPELRIRKAWVGLSLTQAIFLGFFFSFVVSDTVPKYALFTSASPDFKP